MTETLLLDGRVMLRPSEDGSFDELFLYGTGDDEFGGKECLVHMEMMDSNEILIGIYPPGETEKRVVVWIGAKGRLRINADED